MRPKSNMTRRDFLLNHAKMAISTPFLPLLFSREAEANGAVPPRFIAIHSVNGQRQEYWQPRAFAQTSFPGGLEKDLRDFAGTGISPILGPAFDPYLTKLSYIQGLDQVVSNGHNMRALLGHFSLTQLFPTIDRVLAESKKFYPNTPIISSLNFGSSFSYGFSGSQFSMVPYYNSLLGAYERVFGLGQPAILLRHSKVMNRNLSLFNMLKGNPALSSNDVALLDAQSSLLSDLSQRLSSMQPLTGQLPAKPLSHTNSEEFVTSAVDMIVASFLSGATRMACIGITDPSPIESPNGWHGGSHTPDSVKGAAPNSLAINKWIAEKFFLRLISRMDSIIEANGKTMLDNSLVYWGNEVSNGNGHSSEDMPVVLAGSAGGKIRSGFIYDYRQLNAPTVATDNAGSNAHIGRPYNQLLVTILQAMGLTPADYERYGIKGYGVNMSANQKRNSRYSAFIGEVGNPLPRLFTA